MTEPETLTRLAKFLNGTNVSLDEAIAAADLPISPLRLEDELLTVGLESCANCGRWVESDDIVDDDADCKYCWMVE